MTRAEATKKARAYAKKASATYYVVWDVDHEGGFGHTYHVASEEDMDTFSLGVTDRNIIYSTDEE